jgi:hypothetical protein
MNNYWTAISAIFTAIGSCSTAISIVILIATLFYIQREVHLARIATYAGAYKAIVEILRLYNQGHTFTGLAQDGQKTIFDLRK